VSFIRNFRHTFVPYSVDHLTHNASRARGIPTQQISKERKNIGDGSSIMALCCVIFQLFVLVFITTIFRSEFTYQKNFENKTTVTKNQNSASAQCFMGFGVKVNGLVEPRVGLGWVGSGDSKLSTG